MERARVIEFGFKLAVMQNLEMFKEMEALRASEPEMYDAYLDLKRELRDTPSMRPAGFHAVENLDIIVGTPREVLRRALKA